MPLFLHATCTCILHAYVLFFILNVHLHFVLSLSRSWIDCVMASKQRKSILARNPHGFESSSSSIPPTPSYIQFHDVKA